MRASKGKISQRQSFTTIVVASLLLITYSLLLAIFNTNASIAQEAGTPPTLTTMSPNSFSKNGGDTVTVQGTGFNENTQVIIGGALAQTSFINDQTLSVITPAGRAGSSSVKILNSPSLSSVNAEYVTYQENTLTLTGINSAKGPAEGKETLTINGSGFGPTQQDITQLSLGDSHTCGIYETEAYCWGSNTYGQLGSSLVNTSKTPLKVEGALSGKVVTSISAGTFYTCAVVEDGTAYCWGQNGSTGKLGTGNTLNYSTPTLVSTSFKFSSIAAGNTHTCGVRTDSRIACWGNGANNRLGNGTTSNQLTPVLSAALNASYTQLSVGLNHSCAVATNGRLWCWGSSANGQVGNNSTSTAVNPVQVAGAITSLTTTSVSTGDNFTCAIADGKAYCWGLQSNGSTGSGSTSGNLTTPGAVVTSGVLNGKTLTDISSGSFHTCASATDGKVYCWGYRAGAPLGNGTAAVASSQSSPTQVLDDGALQNRHIVKVSARGNATMAVDVDGNAYSWGTYSLAQPKLAVETSETTLLTPTAVSHLVYEAPLVANFSGVPASSVSKSINDSVAEIHTPFHTPGLSSFTVERYDGATATLSDAYEFIQGPTLQTVSPSSGLTLGGDVITIKGEHFDASTKVLFDGNTISETTFIDSETILATTPTVASPATYSVTVADAYGQTAGAPVTHSYRYALPAPEIATVNPDSGPLIGGQAITFQGRGFVNALTNTTDITTGLSQGCSLQGSESIYCWGLGTSGQLGDNTTVSKNTPVKVVSDGVLAGKKIVDINSTQNFTCALSSEGRAYCWGAGTNGQLGNGQSSNQRVPVAVTMSGQLATKQIQQITTGQAFACGLTTDHTVYCWGTNANGELGNGGPAAGSSTPVAVNDTAWAGQSVVSVEAGSFHACATTNQGRVYCWGHNNNGQLGDGTTTSQPIAIEVYAQGMLADKYVTQVSSGTNNTCVITRDHLAYCWGAGTSGKLGNNDSAQSSSLIPVAVDTLNGTLDGQFKHIDASGNATCIITLTNSTYCWGSNTTGQVGDGNTASAVIAPKAVSIPAELEGQAFKSLSTGNTATCAVTYSGASYCWGANNNGQLGTGQTSNSSVPIKVATSNPDALPTITIGSQAAAKNTLELASSTLINATSPAGATAGPQTASATNYDGQTGSRSNAYRYIGGASAGAITPTQGPLSGGDVATITGEGFDETITVYIDGRSVAHTLISSEQIQIILPAALIPGKNLVEVVDGFGQRNEVPGGYTYLIPAPQITSVSPSNGPIEGNQSVNISGANFTNVLTYGSDIATGQLHTCGVFAHAKAYCWGLNSSRQLGANSIQTQIPYPVPVDDTGALAEKEIKQVVAGAVHSCALTQDGIVACWGAGGRGQLGDGSSANRATPVTVAGLLEGKNVTQISAGQYHTCAVTSELKAYCWGYNVNGQLGDGSTASRPTPIEVNLSGVSVQAIEAGGSFTCLVSVEKLVYCVGLNSSGQLGDGTTASKTTPSPVDTSGTLSGKSVTKISSGVSHTCAITNDYLIYCWGLGSSGSLGNGTSSTNSSPVKVLSSEIDTEGAAEISASNQTSCAVTLSGSGYCWGANQYGQLGDGSTTNRLTPVSIQSSGVLADKEIKYLKSGYNSSCAVTIEGHVSCWGSNEQGQIGDNSTTSSTISTPINTALSANTSLEVQFGTTNATDISYVSQNEISSITPAHSAGPVDVIVTDFQGQQANRTNAYTYAAPASVDSISPTQGLTTGGDTVTVSGSGFTEGMKAIVDSQSIDVTLVNETTLQFTSPAATTPGNKTVVIEDSFGQQTTVASGFTYMLPAPTITSVEPNKSRASTLTNVTIRGSGFVSGDYYTISFGGSNGTQINVVDANTLTVRTPSRSAGLVDVTIGGQYVTPTTASNAYTFTPNSYSFTNTRLNIDTNTQGMLTITAGGNAISNVDTEVSLSSSSPTSQFAVNLSENESTRWTHDSVTIPAGESSVNVWFRDSISGNHVVTGNAEGLFEFTQTQIVSSPYRFIVAGISDPIKSGVPSSVTVRVVDRTNTQRTDYTGTINFASTDPLAKLPASYTFKAEDYGIKTFTNGVSFRTAGERCVSVSDSIDTGMNGQQCSITVQQADTGSISRLRVITPEQTIASGRFSAPISIQTQDNTGRAIPVDTDTPLFIYSNSATGEFSNDGVTWTGGEPFEISTLEGSSTTNFYYRDTTAGVSRLTIRDEATTGGADNGWADTYQDITTGASPPTQFAVSGPTALKNGTKGIYTVSLQNDLGKSITADSDVTVRVDSSTTTGLFYTPTETTNGQQGPIEFTIPSGYSSTTIGFSDATITTENPVTLTFADGRPQTETIRLRDGTVQVQIVEDFASRLEINAPGQTEAGVWTPATIQLTDEDGRPSISENNANISLATTSPSARYSLTENGTSVSSVTIPAGATEAIVYYRDTLAATATLTTSGTGLQSAQHTLATSALAPASLVINPTQITAEYDTSTMATVSTYDIYGNVAPVSSGLTVYLHKTADSTTFSSNGTTWDAQSITIPAESSTGVFYVRDASFEDVEKQVIATVQPDVEAADTEVARGTAELIVTSQTVDTIQFTNDTQQITAGKVTQRMQVELLKEDGSPALQDGTSSVAITSTSGTILETPTSEEPISSLTIARGAYRAAFYYTATEAGEHDVTASRSGVSSVSQPVEVAAAAPHTISALATKTNLQVDEATAITLQLKDEFGNDTTTQNDRAIQLSSSCESGSFSSVIEPWQPIESAAISAESGARTLYFRSSLPGDCVLTFASDSLQSATVTAQIQSQTIGALTFSTAAQTVTAGEASQAITLQLTQANGQPAYQDGSTIVTIQATRGQLSLNNTTFSDTEAFAVPAGSAELTVFYRGTVAGTQALTASVESPRLTAQQNIIVQAATPSKLTYTTDSRTVAAGAPSSVIEVSITDEFENETSLDENKTLALSSTCENARFSTSSSEWNDTAEVELLANTAATQFYFRSYTPGNCTVSTATAGLQTATQSIEVYDDSYPYSLQVTTSSDVLVKGAPRAVNVTLLDQYGDTVAANTNTYVSLSTNEQRGEFSSAQVRFTPGQSTATTTYTSANAGTWTLTATHTGQNSLGSASVNATYIEGPATQLLFTQSDIAIAGERTPLAVTSANEYGLATAHTLPTLVTLSSTGAGMFYATESSEVPLENIEIPAGVSSIEVFYRQTESGNATLTAASQALGNAELTLGVRAASIAEVRFMNQPFTGNRAITYGASASYQLQLYDAFGNIATTDARITLNVRLAYGDQVRNTTLTFEAGTSSETYRLDHRQVGPFTITISDQGGESNNALPSVSQEGEVINGAVTSFQFGEANIEMERGSVKQLTVTFVNENGEPTALSQNQTVLLSIPQGTGEFSRSSSFNTTITGFNVAAGQSSATFYYRNNNGQIAPFSHLIQAEASLNGEPITQTAAIEMTYGAAHRLVITTPARSHQQNNPSSILTVEQQNRYGSTVPATEDTTLYVRSSSATAQFGADKTTWPVTELSLKAGSSSVGFYYNDSTQGEAYITVADMLPLTPDTGLRNARQSITTTEQIITRTVDNFLVTNISDPQAAGTPSTVIVIARDADGFIVPTYRGLISFSSNDPEARLPGNYRFTARDAGVAIFNNRIAFTETGLKTVSVTDENGASGQQSDITVIDGSANPISAIAITHPQSLITAPHTVSENVTFELRDNNGLLTTSGLEGLTARLTSDSTSGEFATSPMGPWLSTLEYEVEPGLGFGNFYYRDSRVGEGTITVSDWIDGTDSLAIENATIPFTINSIQIENQTTIQSRNVFGEYEASSQLFSASANGVIQGTTQSTFSAYRMSDSTLANVSWRSEWRKGVTLISSGAQSDQNTISVNVQNITAQAGDTSFYANAQATDTDFSDLYNVVSREVEVPISPWTNEISLNAVDESTIQASVAFRENRTLSSPYVYGYYLVDAEATNLQNAVVTSGALNPGTQTNFTIDASSLDASRSYRLVTITYNEAGDVTSQAATAAFALRETEAETPDAGEEAPSVVSPPTPSMPTNSTAGNTDTETQNDGDVTTEPSPDPVVIPGETDTPEQEVTQDASDSIAPYVALYSAATAGVVVLLLRESWREVLLARFVRRLVNGEQLGTFISKSGKLQGILASFGLQGAARTLPSSTAAVATEVSASLPSGKDEALVESLAKPTLQSFFFWLPIALSVALTIATSTLLNRASEGMVASTSNAAIYATIIGVAVSLTAFFITRSIIVDTEKNAAQRIATTYRSFLDQARSVEITQIHRSLQAVTSRLLVISSDATQPIARRNEAGAALADVETIERDLSK